jgi:hypothetical protein
LPIGLSGEFAPDSENLGGIKFDFANPIDTLNNGIKKTILLKSSQYSKKIGAPVEINLDIVAEETSPNHYIKSGNIRLHYCWKDPFIPCLKTGSTFNQTTFESVGKKNKMIVIDGDLIRNQLDKNLQPVELGYDQRSETYMTTRISC